MSDRPFAPIAASLRVAMIGFYQRRGEALRGTAGLGTLEANSGLVEGRGRPLLEILSQRTGVDSLEGVRVLDLGCGFGALSIYLAAQGAFVTGIDSDQGRLSVGSSVAAQHDLPVEYRLMRPSGLDLPDRAFDLVVADNSLAHLVPRAERMAALREIRRVLRPGGILIARGPNRWNPPAPLRRVPILHRLPLPPASRAGRLLGKDRGAVRLTSPLQAAREIRRAGFTGVEHAASPSSRWPAVMKPVARYHHLIAERPPAARACDREEPGGGRGRSAAAWGRRWPRGGLTPRSGEGVRYQHLILTRYTVKGLFYEDFSQEWLEDRIRVFRGFCVPGIAQQVVGDFAWVVFCDETTDDAYVQGIEESRRFAPQLRVVTTSKERGVRLPQAMAPLINEDTEVLITTRLDTDDTLHAEGIAVLQSYIDPFVRSPHSRWVVNFPRGYRYEDPTSQLYASYWPHGPFMTLFQRLYPGTRDFYDIYKVRHNWLHHLMPLHFDESIPGWLQVIHGLAESTEPGRRGLVVTAGNRESVVKRDVDIEVDPAEAGTAFGIDLRKASDQVSREIRSG